MSIEDGQAESAGKSFFVFLTLVILYKQIPCTHLSELRWMEKYIIKQGVSLVQYSWGVVGLLQQVL